MSRASALHMLVAVVVLLGRLLAPAAAAPGPGALPLEGAWVICHSGGENGPSAPDPGKHDGHAADCQLCPACHLAPFAVLPQAAPALLPAAAWVPVGRPAPVPPATGPPHPIRLAARPTGPPATAI